MENGSITVGYSFFCAAKVSQTGLLPKKLQNGVNIFSQAELPVLHAAYGSFTPQWAYHKILELNLKRQNNKTIQ
jgi:hypothetical protein